MPYVKDGYYCKHCGRPTKKETNFCDTCRDNLTEIDLGRSVFSYEGPALQMVARYKFYDSRYLREFFASELLALMRREVIYGDAFAFVPMTKKGLKKRGFNQSQYLAEELSRLTGTPVLDVIKKVHDTPHQVGLNKSERKENLNGAFALKERKILKGKTVVLVDDVTTTGSTGEVLAKKLKSGGAKKVILLTVASVGYRKE